MEVWCRPLDCLGAAHRGATGALDSPGWIPAGKDCSGGSCWAVRTHRSLPIALLIPEGLFSARNPAAMKAVMTLEAGDSTLP